VVIVWDGARCGLVGAGVHGALGSTLARLTSESISPHYLLYFLRLNYKLINKNPRGTGLPHVNPEIFWNIEIPFPSLPEQRNIISKLESLFSQIRTARAALEYIPALLKAFRQSVLAAAFRGELTGSDPNDEPAEILLQRIRAERLRKWEEILRAKGKDPANYTYEEPSAPKPSNLPELPEGWVWTNLQTLADVRSGVTKGRDLSRFETIEVPYLRVANVQAGFLDLREIKQISIKTDELENYRLQENDVLYTEGGDRDKLGRGTVWKGEIVPCIHQNHIFCARLNLSEVSPEWVSMTGQLEYARDYINSVASQSVNLASINSTNLKAMPIPLPPIQEQLRIVEKIKLLYGQMSHIEIAVQIASHRLDTLEQAALSKAFRGELW
jgi:type I restriction enzyme S subunit